MSITNKPSASLNRLLDVMDSFAGNKQTEATSVSNHSRVSDVAPSPENVSQSEIERLRAINAQLIAALRDVLNAACINGTYNIPAAIRGRALLLDRGEESRARAALNATEKESQDSVIRLFNGTL